MFGLSAPRHQFTPVLGARRAQAIPYRLVSGSVVGILYNNLTTSQLPTTVALFDTVELSDLLQM